MTADSDLARNSQERNFSMTLDFKTANHVLCSDCVEGMKRLPDGCIPLTVPKSHSIANDIDKRLGRPNRGHAIACGSKYDPRTGKERLPGEHLPPYQAKTPKHNRGKDTESPSSPPTSRLSWP